MNRIVANIVVGDFVKDEDISTVYGDMDGNVEGTVITLVNNIPMYVLLRDLGIFKSSSQARKSGWDFNIPEGFTEYPKIGKLRHQVTIWNPTE